jgi:hypothetical protein
LCPDLALEGLTDSIALSLAPAGRPEVCRQGLIGSREDEVLLLAETFSTVLRTPNCVSARKPGRMVIRWRGTGEVEA